jgi:hypothetical protein
VTQFSEDGSFVFVEDTMTGIPTSEVQKADPPAPILGGGLLTSPLKPPVGTAREVSSLQEGEAILQWPATLSADSVTELEDWLKLVVKKMKRRYGVQS